MALNLNSRNSRSRKCNLYVAEELEDAMEVQDMSQGLFWFGEGNCGFLGRINFGGCR